MERIGADARNYTLEQLENRLFLDATLQSMAAEPVALQTAGLPPTLTGGFVESAGQGPGVLPQYSHEFAGGRVDVLSDASAAYYAQEDAGLLGLQQPAFTVRFEGASPSALVAGGSNYLSSYYVGDATQGRVGETVYSAVQIPQLYDGIEYVAYPIEDGLKYEFHVAPGADPDAIRMMIDGALGLSLAPNGDLLIDTDDGDYIDSAPVIYQDINGTRVFVDGEFVLADSNEVQYSITGDYDPTYTLVIDPELTYSTTLPDTEPDLGLPASGGRFVTDVATDGDYTYVVGHVGVTTGMNGFIVKYGPDPENYGGYTALDAATIGGSNYDRIDSITIGDEGLWITGTTLSSDFPNAVSGTRGGGYDAFVAIVDPAELTVTTSRYVGGDDAETGNGIAIITDIDEVTYAIVVGKTESSEFQNYSESTLQTYKSGYGDAYVTKISSDMEQLEWVTAYGSADSYDSDEAMAVAVDDLSDYAYVTGYGYFGGEADLDCFTIKVDMDGGIEWYRNDIGSANEQEDFDGSDAGNDIAVDSRGDVYVIGRTGSEDFLSETTPVGGDIVGTADAFVMALDPLDGDQYWGRYIGGEPGEEEYQFDYDSGNAIAVDTEGNLFVVGCTNSWYDDPYGQPLPEVEDVIEPANQATERSPFVAELSAWDGALYWTTYHGTSSPNDMDAPIHDEGTAVFLTDDGNAYIAGSISASADFNIVEQGYDIADSVVTNGSDGFLSILDYGQSGPQVETYSRNPSDSVLYDVRMVFAGNVSVTADALVFYNLSRPDDERIVPDESGATPVTFSVIYDSTNDETTAAWRWSATDPEDNPFDYDGWYMGVLRPSLVTTGAGAALAHLDGDKDGRSGDIYRAIFPKLSGDCNADGTVDLSDLGILATDWGKTGSGILGDIDGSGAIDLSDLGIMATNWEATTAEVVVDIDVVERYDLGSGVKGYAVHVTSPLRGLDVAAFDAILNAPEDDFGQVYEGATASRDWAVLLVGSPESDTHFMLYDEQIDRDDISPLAGFSEGVDTTPNPDVDHLTVSNLTLDSEYQARDVLFGYVVLPGESSLSLELDLSFGLPGLRRTEIDEVILTT